MWFSKKNTLNIHMIYLWSKLRDKKLSNIATYHSFSTLDSMLPINPKYDKVLNFWTICVNLTKSASPPRLKLVRQPVLTLYESYFYVICCKFEIKIHSKEYWLNVKVQVSKKATKIDEISTLLIFVVFLKNLNFT